MNTNTLKPIRWCALVLCCVLLSTARVQSAEPPASTGNPTTVQPPADNSKDTESEGDTSQDSAAKDKDWSDSDNDSSSDSGSSSGDDSQRSHHHHSHNGNGNDAVVSVGSHADLAAGRHAESVVAVFGSATSAGEVDDSVVSVMGRTRVTGGRVANAAVAVMGSVYVNGEVGGDVVAVLGSVELGPEAKIHGNVVTVGGTVQKDPAATVDGQVQTVFDVNWSGAEWLRPWIDKCLLYGRPLAFASGLGWAWGLALGLLALYVFTAFLFHSGVERCVRTMEEHPGRSVIAALLTMLLTPVLCVLLVITVLGIAVVPFLFFGLFIASVFGTIAVLAYIGRRCTPMLAHDPVLHTVVGVLVGGVIALLIYTIPVIGFIVYKLIGILGLGLVVYTLLIAMRSNRQARSGRSGPNGGPGHTVPSGPGPAGPSSRSGSSEFTNAGAPHGAGLGAAGMAAADAVSGHRGAFGGTVDMSSAGDAWRVGDVGDFSGAHGAADSSGAAETGLGIEARSAGAADAAGIGAGAPSAAGFGAGAPSVAGFGAGAPGAEGIGGGAPGAGGVGTGATGAGGIGAGATGAGATGAGATGAGATGAGATGAGATGAGGIGAGGASSTYGHSGAYGAGGSGAYGGQGGAGGYGGGFGGPGDASAALAAAPRAGFGIRMAALLIDVILIGILIHNFHSGGRFELLVLATYGAVMWKLKGSTIGGIICGLRVARVDGRPIDWPTSIVRALSCFLSLAVVGLGFLWIAIDADRQAWHDKIAGTMVVKAPKGASLL